MKKAAIILLIAVSLGLAGCSKITAKGEKVGTIIKLSQEGIFCKTWEAEMVRGGMSNGSGGFSTTPLHATINDPGILAKVQDAFDKQYEVKVTYVNYLGPFPCASETVDNYFIVAVEPLKK